MRGRSQENIDKKAGNHTEGFLFFISVFLKGLTGVYPACMIQSRGIHSYTKICQ